MRGNYGYEMKSLFSQENSTTTLFGICNPEVLLGSVIRCYNCILAAVCLNRITDPNSTGFRIANPKERVALRKLIKIWISSQRVKADATCPQAPFRMTKKRRT